MVGRHFVARYQESLRMPCPTSLALLLVVASLSTLVLPSMAHAQQRPRYILVLHGGAGPLPTDPQRREQKLAAAREALTAGRDILAQGGTSLEAVRRTIEVMEDNPAFNAGKGSILTTAGECELDASIMDGRDLSAGAVAGIRTVKNPIQLAYRVMTDTPHVLLAGRGAEEFAAKSGLEIVEPSYFHTPEQKAKWKARQNDPQSRAPGATQQEQPYLGTVGCVALDSHGNLAAGTSTGGTPYKLPGRIGDSPLIGAGTYADNRSAAVSCTGVGELFIKRAIAYDVASAVRYGRASLADAVKGHLHDDLPPDTGGLIAIDRDGNIVADFNTQGMARGIADGSGRFEVALGRDE